MAYENSSSFIEGVTRALDTLGARAAVAERLGPEERAMLAEPRKQRWWPGAMLIRVVSALEACSGLAAVERVGYLSVETSVAPVAMPLVKVTIALSGSSPATLFARAGTFAATALRGVKLEWTPRGATEGELTALYAEAVPLGAYSALWRGTLGFVFHLTQATGLVRAATAEQDGKLLRLAVSWTPKP